VSAVVNITLENKLILTMHTRKSARENGKRNPDRMLRNIEPGIANDCRLLLLLSANEMLQNKRPHHNSYLDV